MDKIRRAKYLIAVYLLVTIGAIALLLVGVNYTKDPIWQGIWINLATGLLGVTFLFFLVDRFFLADEWGLSDRIEQLVQRLELSDRPSAQDFFTKQPDLTEHIKNAKRIRLCGVTLTSTLNRQFGHLRERLSKGASIQILVADPESLALRMSALRSEKSEDIEYYSKRLESSFKDIGYLYESCASGELSDATHLSIPLVVRQLSYAPSFNLSQFEGEDGSKIMFVEMYTHGTGFISPPIFKLTPERDRSWYDYFEQQFDFMWAHAKPWEPSEIGKPGESKQRPVAPVTDFLRNRLSVPSYSLEKAATICLSGYTLTRTVREYVRQLDRCLVAGGNVRIMIVDADEGLLEECVKRSDGRTSPSHWRKRLESTESLIEVIAKTPNSTGCMQIGFLPYLPSFGITMLDPDTDHGIIIIEIYHHLSSENNPTFELLANRDAVWYRFFRQQFELMWESCRVRKLPEAI